MVYPFFCADCKNTIDLVCSVDERDGLAPKCCDKEMDWVPFPSTTVFKPTPGRESGFYDLDYGKRATEDLTPPGKMARLLASGRIGDPFAD